MSDDRRPHVDIERIAGNPSEAEERAIIAGLELLIEEERRGAASSLWKRAGRAQGRRLGMSDYRDRFSREDAWRLSARFPYGGREYPGLLGRGDAR